jgi:hypothetical protein
MLLLLFRQLTNPFSNGGALMNLATRILAFFSMHAEQRTKPFASKAPTVELDLQQKEQR